MKDKKQYNQYKKALLRSKFMKLLRQLDDAGGPLMNIPLMPLDGDGIELQACSHPINKMRPSKISRKSIIRDILS